MKRTISRLGLLGVAILFAVGCSTVSYEVDWDHQADFSRYRTFSWLDQKELETAPKGVSPLVMQRLQREITANLAASGLAEAPRRQADLLVAVHTASRQRVTVHAYGGWGYWRPWWGYGGAYAHTWREGSVVLDLIDREKRQLVWRGIAEGAIQDLAPTDEKIRKVIGNLLAAFPPPP